MFVVLRDQFNFHGKAKRTNSIFRQKGPGAAFETTAKRSLFGKTEKASRKVGSRSYCYASVSPSPPRLCSDLNCLAGNWKSGGGGKIRNGARTRPSGSPRKGKGRTKKAARTRGHEIRYFNKLLTNFFAFPSSSKKGGLFFGENRFPELAVPSSHKQRGAYLTK